MNSLTSDVLTLPLAPNQERIWFLQRFDPGDPAYHVLSIQELTGPVEVARLRRALGAAVRRHEPLRTAFREVDGVPIQEIRPVVEDPRIDLVDLDRRTLREQIAAWGDQPFDLSAPPLLRAGLARVADDEYVLVLCAHHLVADGWSMALLRDELASHYAGVEPAEPAGRYRDFVARQLADSPTVDAALAHWKQALAGAPVLTLPTDHPRRPTATPDATRGAVLRAAVPPELTRAVEHLARRFRCTPYMVWLAAYQVLLCRYADQDGITVGTAVAGRDRSTEESLIGYFSGTVVMRADLSDDPCVGDLLRRTRAAAIGAYQHAAVPFERLMAELSAGRDRTRNPLFQTWFNLHSQISGERRPSWGAGVVAHRPDQSRSDEERAPLDRSYDLMIDIWPATTTAETATPTELALTYDRDLFDRDTIADLLRRYLILLAAMAADPDRPVSHLCLLAPGERGALLENPTVHSGPGTVVDMFLAQRELRPDAPAIVSAEGSRTYAQLDADSAAVAVAITAAVGDPAGRIVAIRLPRSPAMVAAVLGTLRAGAAYLPIDPDHPDARVALMLRDSGAALVLTDLAEPTCHGVPTLHIGHLPAAVAPPPPSAPAAYVIYTSGSTGTPKGVVVDHDSLAARVRWMRADYRLTPADRVVQFASLSFDTHAEELYPILAAGGTLLLPPASELFPDWLTGPVGRRATVLDLPTAYWHRLVHDLPADAWPEALRLLIIGGSAAESTAVAAWREAVGDRVELVNTYGPTETTIVATAARLGAAEAVRRPPIGAPIGQTAAYVLDPGGRPVPVGIPGELYLAGAGVARGYLNRPELTAERFLDDPFGPPGRRMFRTGDRVRLLRDGQLEYRGRTDRQLKVRGYRIEPGEIEAALSGHPDVTGAVVTARDDLLVAYVVPESGRFTAGTLRDHLAAVLPAYLVPGAFVALDRIPLTTSGKPDLAALPAPATAIGERPFVAPRTAAEELIADIWAEVLGREKIGALDDFFELGGHSLLATRVIARLRAETDLELPLRALFAAPTVAGVAAAVDDLLQAELDGLSPEEVQRLLVEGAA